MSLESLYQTLSDTAKKQKPMVLNAALLGDQATNGLFQNCFYLDGGNANIDGAIVTMSSDQTRVLLQGSIQYPFSKKTANNNNVPSYNCSVNASFGINTDNSVDLVLNFQLPDYFQFSTIFQGLVDLPFKS